LPTDDQPVDLGSVDEAMDRREALRREAAASPQALLEGEPLLVDHGRVHVAAWSEPVSGEAVRLREVERDGDGRN
jgi:hypothetical protein